ncbi:inositol hexakisphosphate-domain-containing protein [Hyaloraphidium curvatum]|nr:inositol hexakisphosphate-domain-containing protein [Hyaloraphidium curvatum]
MLLVHDELPDSRVIPSWIAVGEGSVHTPAQLFAKLAESYRVEYHRLPLSPESAPTPGYLDDYLRILRRTGDDPVVVHCGRGVGRTTWAMIALGLIRARQRAVEAAAPHVEVDGVVAIDRTESASPSKRSTKRRTDPRERPLEEELGNRAVLRLLYVLEKALPKLTPHATLTSLLASPPLLSDLKLAIQGSYTLITQLTSFLPEGVKASVDAAIDANAGLVNLRENVLVERVRGMEGEELDKAVCALERYFWLIALAGYLEECCVLDREKELGGRPRAVFSCGFSAWLERTPWMTSTMAFLHARPLKPSALGFFSPLGDLTYLVKPPKSGSLALYAGAVGTEVEQWVVRSRRGAVLASQLLLKLDSWPEDPAAEDGHPGAANFRRIPGLPVYASSQPSLPALASILAAVAAADPPPGTLVWINLREEPIIYVRSRPHVLRQTATALRNLRSYTGISAANLERVEEKLAEDVRAEIDEYGGRVLVHSESGGQVVPLWVEGDEGEVRTARSVFGGLEGSEIAVEYERIPMTAEQPPQEEDLDNMLDIMLRHRWDGGTAVVFNCQMGIGRSTTGTVVAALVLRWLRGESGAGGRERRSYKPINALLRVLRDGLGSKRTVDAAVDLCAAKVNLRDCVDDWRGRAAKESGENRAALVKRGLKALERYFLLICFQNFLDAFTPAQIQASRATDRPRTFRSWVHEHAEFATLRTDLLSGDLDSLAPLMPSADTEVSEAAAVASRCGAVLCAGTILKPDFFPGMQRKSLPERVEGAPNYRRIPLGGMKAEADRVRDALGEEEQPALPPASGDGEPPFMVGDGMPSCAGIANVAERCGAGPGGGKTVLWTSLREEPVVYILGAPYVLRELDDPLRNLVITGITAERVETMEERLKEDVVAEARRFQGRFLLHDEEADEQGYRLVPVWQPLNEGDVQTPLELYQSVIARGFSIEYSRVPITDEQAPIPGVFDILLQRVLGRAGGADMVYNCQMGRGRTTTGLAVTCLCEMVAGNPSLLARRTDSAPSPDVPSMRPGPRPLLRSTTTADDLAVRYAAHGEYRLILSLLPVLAHGKLAKRLADRAIDLCAHMQNLREAIYHFRVAGPSKIREGLSYLTRYFFLICFADYLLAEWAGGKGKQTFVSWLADRPEITSILKNQTLD